MSPNNSKTGSELEPEILSAPALAKSAETGLGIANFLQPPIRESPSSDPNNWFNKAINKLIAVVKWVIKDFKLKHLVRFSRTTLVPTYSANFPVTPEPLTKKFCNFWSGF